MTRHFNYFIYVIIIIIIIVLMIKHSFSFVLQVWESRSGICLHTLGPGSEDGAPGHTKKISAMAVNELQPCKHIACVLLQSNRVMIFFSVVHTQCYLSLQVMLRYQSIVLVLICYYFVS